MKKSCQDLEKNLGKIFSRSCKNLARNQAIQDFRMDLEQESCKIRKILASSKSWHGFETYLLPTCQILKRLGKILQDIFDRAPFCRKAWWSGYETRVDFIHICMYLWQNQVSGFECVRSEGFHCIYYTTVAMSTGTFLLV